MDVSLTHGSLFSGLGGFDLASEWMGWNNSFHCEWNPFGKKVLKYYWPNATSYEDITKTDFTIWRGKIDVLTGGFPCQPYSVAGKRKGKEDDRHLWPEMLRAIQEIKPRWIVGENVRGIVNWSGGLVFEEVQSEMEAEGYEVQTFILPASSVKAPHRRDRVWFVAYSGSNGQQWPKESEEVNNRGIQKGVAKRHESDSQNGNGPLANTTSVRGDENNWERESGFTHEKSEGDDWENFPTQHPICSGNDGLSSELDGITFSSWRNKSIQGYGNTIVPQVILQIFKTIEEYENNYGPPEAN